jgi:hypothetical protein
MKNILLAVIVMLSSSRVLAQLRVEIVAGPNMSSSWGPESFDDSFVPKFSFTTGVGMTYGLRRENRFIHAQLLYERKGERTKNLSEHYRYIDGGDPVKQSSPGRLYLRHNYLTLPVMYGFEGGQRVRWAFSAGPYVSVLLRSVSYFSNSKEDKSSNDPNNFDVGLSGNIGLYIPVSSRTEIKIGLQENFGLLNVFDGAKNKNQSLNFQVGWCVKLSD